MVLEWLAGRSLADDLDERRKRGHRGRTLDEAFALLEPAAEGLAVAHHRRVAHRDIKPANFFLLDGDTGPRVKVLDFGIAKIIRDGEGPGTRSPFASFTWLYAAPEQLEPRLGQSGLATDVYSFALLLTELLTDRLPTDGRDVVSLLKAAVDPTVRPTPRQRGAIVSDAVEAVCRRALAVEPRARFATVGELWGALTAARSSASPLSSGQLPVSNLPPTMPAASGGAAPSPPVGPGVYIPPLPGSSPPGPPPVMQGVSSVGMPGASPYAPTFMHGAGVPSQGGPLTRQEAAALSPPRMTPPPGMPMMAPKYPPRRMVPTSGPSALPVVLAVIGLVIGLMFVATCPAVHAAC
jgi:serine/threonine-protein kinase